MAVSDGEDQAARAFNAQTAERYDSVAYAPAPEPMLDLERLFGLGVLYGCEPLGAPDVLDIGCGAGVQLERAAAQTAGRLVGTDISKAACAEAERKLGGYADRTRILAADLLDLEPETLGRFDAIYCVGVLYVVPPAVRRQILRLIGACLKPGGVAVISYYAGGLGLMRAELNRMIRAVSGPDQPLEARLDQAQGFLKDVASQFQRGDAGLPAQTAQLTATYTDRPTLLHETLCDEMTALHTTELQAALEGEGLGFLSYIHGLPCAGMAPSSRRAVGADIFDFMWGGYRYGVFGKPTGEAPPSAVLAQAWSTVLTRQAGGPVFPAPAEYKAAGGGGVRVSQPIVQAALDALAEGPLPRTDLHAAARGRLAAASLPAPGDAEALLDGELQKLWQAGGVAPLWLGA